VEEEKKLEVGGGRGQVFKGGGKENDRKFPSKGWVREEEGIGRLEGGQGGERPRLKKKKKKFLT